MSPGVRHEPVACSYRECSLDRPQPVFVLHGVILSDNRISRFPIT